ncbi:DNA cytosine methyltransferase [Pseudomonas putida]|uniref:DNA cytosine methyltransferase n=1 Tax=Pseudomonas putida TaxID=303 RepID=UPI002364509B|nr:DNA cytosine methyltransferase [Pseudomonas putida]MDD2139366.1 DNA cytosine methyltransferase [Pseudomonas putida]HDS1726830.1 DNA cytosine methyltransferase [Pseudomonas putida]
MSAFQKKNPLDFKTQYGLGFDPQDDEIVVDFFCGGGGAGTGLEMGLGRPVTVAKNHSPAAISMHTANHPAARHFTTDVFDGDPDEECQGRPVGWFHMSPDCTHHSQAAGGQPRKREIRNLSWIGLKWAGKKRPRVISLENVKQILQWGPLMAKRDKATGRVMKLDGTVAAVGERVPVQQQFLVPDPKRRGITWRRFVHLLEGMGYQVEWRIIKACDFGAPTSRERLFMIARCDEQPIVWPEPTHAKNPAKGQQKWRTAADCIDWNVPSKSIFGRKKELAAATLRRVAKGMKKFVLDNPQPFIVPIANWSGELAQSANEPLRTVTSWPRGGSFAVASPVMIGAGGPIYAGKPVPADQPMGTLMTQSHRALVTAFIEQANGGFNTTPAKGADEPLTTVTNTGSQQRLVTASLATLRRNCVGRPVDDLVPTMTAGAEHHALVEYKLSPEHEEGALRVAAFLISYYGTENISACDSPAPTVTTKDRLGLVTVFVKGTPYVIVDICLRMLQPHELYRAQGFPASYIIDKGADGKPFTKTEQVHMCGNSVSPPPMAALARANDPWRVATRQAHAA